MLQSRIYAHLLDHKVAKALEVDQAVGRHPCAPDDALDAESAKFGISILSVPVNPLCEDPRSRLAPAGPFGNLVAQGADNGRGFSRVSGAGEAVDRRKKVGQERVQ